MPLTGLNWSGLVCLVSFNFFMLIHFVFVTCCHNIWDFFPMISSVKWIVTLLYFYNIFMTKHYSRFALTLSPVHNRVVLLSCFQTVSKLCVTAKYWLVVALQVYKIKRKPLLFALLRANRHRQTVTRVTSRFYSFSSQKVVNYRFSSNTNTQHGH